MFEVIPDNPEDSKKAELFNKYINNLLEESGYYVYRDLALYGRCGVIECFDGKFKHVRLEIN